jgi:Tol biopolymer transport system component
MTPDPSDDLTRAAETVDGIQSAFGAYRIEGRLGAGGMGTVYRATDTRLGRAVAVKVAAAQYCERFHREARAISALNHPNICTLYDVGPNYLVMELLDGPTLADEIKKGPVAPELASRYGAQIAAALAEAHAHGIVHRDLKPGNIVLTRHGIKVLDFGIAKMISQTDLTATSVVLGTPAYMAPEQVQGANADSRTDLYALGLVLYEMIRGTLPVPGASLGLMLSQGSAVPIDPPCKAGTKFASPLNTLILGLLQREPDRRPQSAEAVREQLLSLAGQTERPRRGRSVTMGVLAIVLALLATSVWWSFRSRTAARWPEVSRVSPVTAYAGSEITPAVSADGEWVAFSWEGEQRERRDIYVMRVDGLEHARRLTHEESADTIDIFPAWAPDGQRIAFVRRRGPTDADIIMIPAQGGEERKLHEIRFLSFPASSWLTWTPDGEQIVFASTSLESGRSTLFLMKLSDGSVRQLLSPPNGVIGDASPALSPDGRLLAFLRWSSPSTSSLLVQKIGPDGIAEGGPATVPIGASLVRPESVTWVDNHRLLFNSGQRIMKWEADSEPTQIYLSGSELAGLAVAKRGANGTPRLIVAQRRVGVPRVWEIPLRSAGQAAGPPQLLPGLGNDSGAPEFSPDGKALVFASRRTGNSELWTADANGNHVQQLTQMGFKGLGVPRWSPDNHYVAFFARSDTEPQIYVIDATRDHAVPVQVTRGTPGCNIPTWSKDGRFVYCSRRIDGEMRLYRVSIENGEAGRGEMERWFEGKEARETSDGRLLYIKDDRPGLFVRALAGDPTANPEERLVTDIRGPIAYFASVPEGVYYTGQNSSGGYLALRFFDYASRKNVEVAPARITGQVNSLAVSPDGRRLAFTQSGRADEFDLSRIEF